MKKENKKKVVTLSAMAALLAVVLGMGGKTYAKYFTSANTDAQNATVAQFGMVLTTDASNLWGKQYKEGTDADTLAMVTEDGTLVVSANGSVVAPGTKGTVSFSVEGVAEVNAVLSFNINVTSEVNIGEEYYPMKWTNSASGKLEDVVIDEIQIPASSDPFTKTIEISWEWPFYTDDDTDTLDTILAKTKAGKDLNADETTALNSRAVNTDVKFTLTASLTQVQAF